MCARPSSRILFDIHSRVIHHYHRHNCQSFFLSHHDSYITSYHIHITQTPSSHHSSPQKQLIYTVSTIFLPPLSFLLVTLTNQEREAGKSRVRNASSKPIRHQPTPPARSRALRSRLQHQQGARLHRSPPNIPSGLAQRATVRRAVVCGSRSATGMSLSTWTNPFVSVWLTKICHSAASEEDILPLPGPHGAWQSESRARITNNLTVRCAGRSAILRREDDSAADTAPIHRAAVEQSAAIAAGAAAAASRTKRTATAVSDAGAE